LGGDDFTSYLIFISYEERFISELRGSIIRVDDGENIVFEKR